MAKSAAKSLPPRSKVPARDCWNLDSLYPSDAAWEKAFALFSRRAEGYRTFRGKLGRSAVMLAKCLKFDSDLDRLGDRLGTYAYLKMSQDQASSGYQRMKGRFQHAATRASEAASFIRPEIIAIPKAKMDRFLKDKAIAGWRIALERILRYRPHTLGNKEEELIAMQGQMAEASNQVFRQLNDADLKWPAIENEKGEMIELGHSSYSAFMQSPSHDVRKNAYHTYYSKYEEHKNTIAAALDGSVQRDVYYARARKHKSALDSALFADRVPMRVYDNLIGTVHKHLPTLYRYYEIRRRKLKLKEIHHYDTYVPILSDMEKHHTWDQAVKLVVESLSPLGEGYCTELGRGLTTGRWCDRYPNAGKQSGAFSAGSYDGQPYILMNYQPRVFDHVFTLAHEAGHSMHSYYSAKHQPYPYYNYTIFVAEVASTFNEQLLLAHLLKQTGDKRERAYLVNHAIDEIRGTIIRQTMFAEFEKLAHALVEAGEPLTVEQCRGEYRKLLELYFGPDFAIDKELELECLRIPHFYRAFYVYKYATGLSAAIALSQRVLGGGQPELNDYLGFLKGGCSRYPLELLKGAGVDMEKPAPIEAAMGQFGRLVEELEELL